MDLAGARSALFAPGNDERKLRRALESSADLVVADLEDSVHPSQKGSAREVVGTVLSTSPKGRLRAVRINACDAGDASFVAQLAEVLDAVVVPKAVPSSLRELQPIGLPLLAIVETAAGVLAAPEAASVMNVTALCLGNLDLTAELGLSPRDDGAELWAARSQIVLASAAAGLRQPFDGVHENFRNLDSLRAEIDRARSLGFGGKLCIHPAQIGEVNTGFSPTDAELAWAREVIEADHVAASRGSGVAVVAGQMIDAPVVARARRLLKIAASN